MGLETPTHIDDLVATNPLAGDSPSQGDDHLRAIKLAVQASLPDSGAPSTPTYVTGGGAANAHTVTLTPAPASYSTGMLVRFAPTADNTATATLNVNALGAKTIKTQVGNALVGGELNSNGIHTVVYDGTDFILLDSATAKIQDATDETKQIAIDASGLTTATTRTITIPDENVSLKAPTVQAFTASGTYTKPTGLRVAIVEVVGGGGAGGGAAATVASSASAGGGGGAGGYARERLLGSAIGATETVTIGAGGAGVSGATGNSGGTTSFGALLSATGGTGGSKVAASTGFGGTVGVVGGTGSGGDINADGAPGDSGIFSGLVDATTGFGIGGAGGSSIFGGGGASRYVVATQPGFAASNYGSGGGGAANGVSQSAVAGGAGSDGIVIVTEFY